MPRLKHVLSFYEDFLSFGEKRRGNWLWLRFWLGCLAWSMKIRKVGEAFFTRARESGLKGAKGGIASLGIGRSRVENKIHDACVCLIWQVDMTAEVVAKL